jgi:D-alanyl-D-alanine carboxypeptidase
VVPLFTTLDDLSHIPDIDGPTMSNRRKQFTLFILQQKPNMDNALSKKKPVFSIAAYVMAASMMEKVAGKKWEGLVNEYLNKALDISIKYGWPNLNDASAPAGHWSQGSYFHAEEAETWVRPNAILYPAHHINITLPDYIKFMQENLKGLAGQKAHITQKTLEYIHYGILDYSMGWYNGTLNDNTYSFHEGIAFLFDCRVSIIREKNIGIIVMCNSGDSDGRGAVLNLSRILEDYYLNN